MRRIRAKTVTERRLELAQELEGLARWFRDPERLDIELASALGLSVSHFGGTLADYDAEIILRHVGAQIGQTVKALAREREFARLAMDIAEATESFRK